MAASDAPLSNGTVTLRAKDRAMLAEYYESIIGLRVISRDSDMLTMGVGNRILLKLQEDRSAKIRPTAAGLYHTAFMLPARNHLGAWLNRVVERRVNIDGVSDHRGSEEVYPSDPEGNGIEVYVDRARSKWSRVGDNPKPTTGPLDVRSLRTLPDYLWKSAPDETVIGHVHLQVGNIEELNAFYSNDIGFSIVNEMPQATFYASGGYHHHIAVNTWHSKHAGKRSPDATGLLEIELLTIESDAGCIDKT